MRGEARRGSDADPAHESALLQELEDVGPLEHHQAPIERMLRVPALRDEKVPQARIGQGPADREPVPLPEFLLDRFDLLHQFALGQAVDVAGLDGVHRRSPEEPDRLVDVRFGDLGPELDLGQRFRDSDDGFKLTVSDDVNERGILGGRDQREGTDRTVMGIEERSLLSRSTCCTCLRSATK